MKSEINGFLIDVYNQYGLKEGAKYSTCPLCSTGRRSSNKNVKCVSLDWNTALGTCHHCGARLQLHTYKKKEKLKSYYAYEQQKDGRIKYYHDDGTITQG